MARQVLTVSKREDTGKNASRRLRRTGDIPGVVYGAALDALAISVNRRVIDRILHSDTGENTLFQLQLDGTDQNRTAMVKDYQLDPVTDLLIHCDFIRIRDDEELHLQVPVHLIGVPLGVSAEDGRLEFPTREVEVACLPANIPSSIDVDVTDLHLHQTLHAGDLSLPEGVRLLSDEKLMLASVHAKAEEEEAPAEEATEATEGAEGEGAETDDKKKKEDS